MLDLTQEQYTSGKNYTSILTSSVPVHGSSVYFLISKDIVINNKKN